MKTTLVATLLTGLAALSLRADLIWYESFNYVNGPIIATGTNLDGSTNWVRHSGSANPSDAVVSNHRLQVATTSPPAPNPLSRQDDVNRPFATVPDSPYTNAQQLIYASFTLNCTNLPLAAGAYFAHFKDTTTSNFAARVFAMTGTPGSGGYPTNFTALPGTYRLGIAAAGNAPNQTFPVDLALNTDYQVVVGYDPVTLKVAMLWVDPLSSADTSVTTGDTVPGAVQSAIMSSYAFRQATSSGNGFFTISNLAVATTFDEAATNVWGGPPVPPAVVYQPVPVTNYSGNPAVLAAVAAGQGLAGLTYQWQNNGVNVSNPNGNSNVLTIASLSAGDDGPYTVVVSNPGTGLSTTSQVAYVSVNTTPTAPTFATQPRNTTNFVGATVTLSASVSGTGPLTYQWLLDGNPVSDGPGTLPGDASLTSGSQTSTLTIANISTNQTGTYTLVASGGVGAPVSSSPAFLAVLPPRPVTVAFLRSLLDTTSWQTTDGTSLFNITGTITTFTNLTSGNTSSYYLQDDTGGINLFISGLLAPNFRPMLGDIVTASGTLVTFNNNLELQCLTANPYQTYSIIGHTNLPAPYVFSFGLTNNPGLMETNLEGRFIMITNVFFTNTATLSSSANVTITVTNALGQRLLMFFPNGTDPDSRGKTLPSFAWTVSGVMNQFASGSTYTKAGYEITVTRWADVVTAPPPAVTADIKVSASGALLTWEAVPYSYSYSIFAATDAAGPYTPLATGLTFTTTAASFLDTDTSTSPKFYRISSP